MINQTPADVAAEIMMIRQLQSRYNMAGDRGHLESLAQTFLPDGVLETPARGRLEGRAAIIAGLGGIFDVAAASSRAVPLTVLQHHLTTADITLTGPDCAEGRTYFQAYTDIGPDHTGTYIDHLRKVGGNWFIEYRRLRMDWVADDSLFPDSYAAYKQRISEKSAKTGG